MRTYSTTEIIRILKEKNLALFSLDDFDRLFNLKKKNTLYKKIQRLEKTGLVRKLIKGKYRFLLEEASDFICANFLYQPSYISLESAMSFYGISTGFSYKITSIAIKKSRTFIVENKEYQYSKISAKLFWGYEKSENFLIAEREKALLDYIYFHIKGLKPLEKEDLDLAEINKKKIKIYTKKFNNKKMLTIINQLFL